MVGLDWRSAPLAVRERLQLGREDQVLHFLGQLPWPAVVLATCHRVEVYVHVAAPVEPVLAELERLLAGRGGLSPAAVTAHAIRRNGEAAVRHLVEVACGLQSAVLGEPQILGQVRAALELARRAQRADWALHRLFERAVHAGKEVRTQTRLGRGGPSLARAAVRRLAEAGLDGAREELVVVGSGEMAMLAVREAAAAGWRRIIVCARRPDQALARAEAALAGRDRAGAVALGARAIGEMEELLAGCGAVISATTAPGPVILAPVLRRALERRAGRRLCVVDLAVPRDVEVPDPLPAGLHVWSVDELVPAEDSVTLSGPEDLERARALAAGEAAAYLEWYRQRRAVDALRDLRRQADAIREEELALALRRLGDGLSEAQREVLARMAHRLTNKLLHLPMLYLKAVAAGEVTQEEHRAPPQAVSSAGRLAG